MSRTKKTSPSPIDFEASLNQLNQLIEKMESGKLDLNESLTCFEQGVTLIKQCQQVLSEAEEKVTLLTQPTSNKND